MAVLIDSRQRRIPVNIHLIRRDSLRLLRLFGIDERAELSVVLAAPSAMRRLNLRYRGVDAATDVLSFPQFASEGRPLRASRLFKGPSGKKSTYEILSGGAMAPLALGDIVICPAKALEFAAEGGLAQAGAIRALLVHGFLHLMGYEHSPGGARARRMRAKEHELMKALG